MSQTLDPAAYDKLKRVAAYYMSGERPNHTLCPTALVNEAFLKFHKSSPAANRSDFLIQAARNMRQILVNHAHARNALKRGGGGPTLLQIDEQAVGHEQEIDIVALDDALTRLQAMDETKARIVELRYFSGLSNQEIAAELNLSIATIKRRWVAARAWLYRELA